MSYGPSDRRSVTADRRLCGLTTPEYPWAVPTSAAVYSFTPRDEDGSMRDEVVTGANAASAITCSHAGCFFNMTLKFHGGNMHKLNACNDNEAERRQARGEVYTTMFGYQERLGSSDDENILALGVLFEGISNKQIFWPACAYWRPRGLWFHFSVSNKCFLPVSNASALIS